MVRPKKNWSEPGGECWVRGKTLLKALELSLLAITALGTVTLIILTLVLIFEGG